MPKRKILAIDDSPTILKILDVILKQAGYDVLLAPDGIEGIKLAREQKPDLIILDFIMPKMNGFQVCKMIRKDKDLSHIPVILMSAKGEKVGNKFIDMMGAIDYLTKPFSPESLLSLIPHSLQKAPAEIEKVTAEPTRDDILTTTAEKTVVPDETGDGLMTFIRKRLLAGFDMLSETLLKAGNKTELIGLIDEVLSESLNEELFEMIKKQFERYSAAIAGEGISMRGLLSQVPLPEVFQFTKFQNHTGLLVVTDIKRNATVFVTGGSVAFATFTDPDSKDFNEKIFEGSDLDPYTIKKAARLAASSNATIIDIMIKEKIWDRSSLYRFLDYTTRETIYEILTWKQGSFSFHLVDEHIDIIKEIDLGIIIDQLVMDGLRRLDELNVIRKTIHSDSQVFIKNESADINKSKLSSTEAAILPYLDGIKEIGLIKEILKISTFDFSKALYNLLNEGHIKEVTQNHNRVNK